MGYAKMELRKFRKPSVGSMMWKWMSLLPMFIRGPLVRNFFSADYTLPTSIVFKQAETLEEVQQALELVYEAYRDRGLVEELKNKMRATKYHLLPTTGILICKDGEKVIATVSLIVDSGMGLPVDDLWNISHLRQKSMRLAEVATLAIDKSYRSKRGGLLLPLCAYLFQFSRRIGVDRLVASYHPNISDFYRCVLMFDDLGDGKVSKNTSVKGALAVGGTIDLNTLDSIYKKAYGNKAIQKNMHHLFCVSGMRHFRFNEDQDQVCSRFLLTPDMIQSLFNEKTGVTAKLSQKDASVVAEMFHHPSYKMALGVSDIKTQRSAPRFAASLPVSFGNSRMGAISKSRILEISRHGLKLCTQELTKIMAVGDRLVMRATLPSGESVMLVGEVIWTSEKNSQVGLHVVQASNSLWDEFVTALETDLDIMASGLELMAA